ncbi:hypothetical protein V498_04989 [Pseudogymnoascus sp. VKM F-4517 (FW-2822)]|nr:hypothetical protein V498_04989 [Pseudogymnoascus sp. VKM F-4517 (FW-2822)]
MSSDVVESLIVRTSASASASVVETIAGKTWECVEMSTRKHSLFDQIFPDRERLFDSVAAAPLQFCPGLLEAMNAPSPPPPDFFKSLPSNGRGKWGVYALVLEKAGFEPLVYIGSGTNADSGVRSRWSSYDRRNVLPRFVKVAFDTGYTVTHKGLLMWSAIPAAAEVPCLRLLFVAIEATFSFMFWTMYSKTKDYGMGGICQWPRDEFAYYGLCSHNAMYEGVMGNFDLTADQLEAIAATMREKTRAYMAEYRAAHQAETKVYMAEYHQRARLEEGYQERQRIGDARFREKSHDKYLAKFARYAKKQKESKAFFCELCNHASTKPFEHDRHLQSKRHLEKAARNPKAPPARKKNRITEETNKASKKFFCALCDVACTSPYELNRHGRSKRHLAKSAKAAAAAESSSSSA